MMIIKYNKDYLNLLISWFLEMFFGDGGPQTPEEAKEKEQEPDGALPPNTGQV